MPRTDLHGHTVSFNSRPHKEVDEGHVRSHDRRKSFNSRPHKEVDCIRITVCILVIHLSIHDLTRRSTCMTLGRWDSTTFQFTTSQGGRPSATGYKGASEAFQFTTSQGGRPVASAASLISFSLSIHDLTRRSTTSAFAAFTAGRTFQFTTSQGGRHAIQKRRQKQ